MTTERIQKLQDFLNDNSAVILFDKSNRLYFSNFVSSAGAVVITKSNCFLFVDFRYFEKAKNTVKNMEVILCERLYLQIGEKLAEHKIKTVFVETESLSVAKFEALKQNYPQIEISNQNIAEGFIKNLRSVKSREEVDFIKQAQYITDKTFDYILDRIAVGRSEREIALEMEFFMRQNGSEGIAFDTIAISGKNTSLPHGVPSDKKIENGDFFTMDFGAVSGGYCSDMTRTVAIGKITEKQKFVYDIVLKAQLEAISKIKAGVICKDIDAVARNIIYSKGFEGCFGHGLGHSVGLEIHENPVFNTRDETILKSATVITVEPGIYLENEFGVRIEDMVLVTENGIENLTKSPKELIIV